jgi:hypothetical protein
MLFLSGQKVILFVRMLSKIFLRKDKRVIGQYELGEEYDSLLAFQIMAVVACLQNSGKYSIFGQKENSLLRGDKRSCLPHTMSSLAI